MFVEPVKRKIQATTRLTLTSGTSLILEHVFTAARLTFRSLTDLVRLGGSPSQINNGTALQAIAL
jgi:hypothetical protein